MKKINKSELTIYEFNSLLKSNNLEYKVDISLFVEDENTIELNEIWSNYISKGYASKTINLLTKLCDKNNIDIILKVEPLRYEDNPEKNKNLLTKQELIKFYEKNGFKIVNKKEDIMKRKNNLLKLNKKNKFNIK